MNKLLDLLQKRAKIVADARAIVEKATEEGRPVTAEEQANVDKAIADAEAINAQVKSIEKLEAVETSIGSALDRFKAAPPTAAAHDIETRAIEAFAHGGYKAVPKDLREPLDAAQGRAFAAWFRQGSYTLTPEMRAALNITDATKGGYLQPPPAMMAAIIKGVDDLVWLRRLGNVMTMEMGEQLNGVSLDTDVADCTWTNEIPAADIAEDDAVRFGNRAMSPHPFVKLIKISKDAALLRNFDLVGFIAQRIAYKQAITLEKAYLTGSGSNQPLGLFTASDQGIPTSRDVSTGNTATAITMAGLKNAQYALKAQYRMAPGVGWLFHRTAVSMIAALREDTGGAGTGGYLWQPSVQVGQPDRLLGYPVYESEYVPSTFTTALYVGMLGAFNHYQIVDGPSVGLQRLVELFALKRQDGLIATMYGDGQPILSEAFVRIKLA